MTGQPFADIPLTPDDPLGLERQWLGAGPDSFLGILNGYLGVFVVAFVVTLLATPLMRRLALANGIIDHPSDPRKVHTEPVAYLGGAAVFLGLMGGILFSYLALAWTGLIEFHSATHLIDGLYHAPVPISVILGLFVIMLVGLLDDVVGIEPRIKIGGQLFAAAALAIDNVGVNVARGVLAPIGRTLIGNSDLAWTIPVPVVGETITFDLIYWTGTAIIGLFVLGACNASNLIDGLDGLLSGVTSVCAAGLLVVAVIMAMADDGPRDAQRIVLAMALMGACLGFLPHNFNPASIFLGDCGSLLLGFCTIVVILTLGDTGKTHLVTAGLIIYAIPLIDTTLAMIRRKMAGRRISDPDDQHLHHMLKRAMGVKRAVLTLYAIGAGFAVLGVAASFGRARVVYTIALVFISFIAVTAIKLARRFQPAPARKPAEPWEAAAGAREPEPAARV
ncbi:MAG: undecaprenyl/decaprenyl-phosphate alpha-N-acetylglucosaminyl 1-phosphate transferase [Chloroflexi bacterium]|nr:undecaprenyl/decaprenyl-phosphate alpha-N-acetylglucosaminyl 1-phosphate transferase [Chloroflexota bacterium]